MTFELLCMSLIAMLFGIAVCFNGYRWFIFLLPVFGFFMGFFIGAETLQALFGYGFLASVTSWIVGFFVGLIFAVLSYLFYMVGIALISGAFGYALGVGLMGLIIDDFGLLVWIVGIITGVVIAAVVLLFNIQKWAVIIITAFGGAGVIVGSFLYAFGWIKLPNLVQNPVRFTLQQSPLMMILFLVLGVLGVIAQWRINRDYVLEEPEAIY
ncbi:MAG: DUF4203 domain-containing protein [Chloroflexota bacterium]|nr:DUF4203 domain-containing protein [Chloroflexota bacterium]